MSDDAASNPHREGKCKKRRGGDERQCVAVRRFYAATALALRNFAQHLLAQHLFA